MTDPGMELTWSIGEAAHRAGVSPGTVRAWEREGLVSATRSPGGKRRFPADQVRRLERIAYLRTVKGLNVAGVRAALQDAADEVGPSASESGTAPYGEFLRRTRRAQGHTLADVSAGTGLSVSYLSALERDHVGAAVSTMRRLLAFYRTTETAMLTNEMPVSPRGTVTRDGRRTRITDRHSRLSQEQLLPAQPHLGAALTTVDPGGASHSTYRHEGHEFIYVLSGSFRVRLRDEQHDLAPSDCLFFDSDCPHSWENAGDEPATLLWVITPPNY